METNQWTLRAYLIECTRQAPSSFKKGQAILTFAINAIAVILLIVGYNLSVPIQYIFVAAILFALFEVIIAFPYKVWKADKQEIARLKNDKNEAKDRLWRLLYEGFDLRTRGIKITLEENADKYKSEFEEWRNAILSAADKYSSDLGHLLRKLGTIDPENKVRTRFNEKKHPGRVHTVAEIVSRLEKYLKDRMA